MKYVATILVGMCCAGAQLDPQALPAAACAKLDPAFSARLANLGPAEAEKEILAFANGAGSSCAGQLLTDLATVAAVSGRLDDAVSLSERAIQMFQREHSPDDPIFVRPLFFIAHARFEHGETSKGRKILERMQSIRSENVHDRIRVHDLAASLLVSQGRNREAESEYVAGLTDLEGAGLGDTRDAGSLWIALNGLYIKEHRLDDATRALDRASAISNSAADATPLDRIGVLLARGALLASRREWAQAEQDLRNALAIADGAPRLDPDILLAVLTNYAQALRKNHHASEARSIEVRAAGLHRQAQVGAIVDVTELAGRAGLKK